MNCGLSLCKLHCFCLSHSSRNLSFGKKYLIDNFIYGTKYDKYILDHVTFMKTRQLSLLRDIHAKGYKTLNRRAIGVVRHDIKGKTLNEYLEQTKAQSAEIMDDETEFLSSKSPSNVKMQTRYNKHQGTQFIPKPKHQNGDAKIASAKNKPINRIVRNIEEDIDDGEESSIVMKNLNIKKFVDAGRIVRTLFENSKSTRSRHKYDVFMLEGWRSIADALKCGLKPYSIFFSRSRLFLNMAPVLGYTEDNLDGYLNLFPLYKTPYSTFKLWSSLVTPPGIMAAFPLSAALEMCSKPKHSSFPLTVILDGIGDPNNLGSILRTLGAAGVAKIILMKGCCDPWDSKVLRSSSGAHFHMSYVTRVPWSNVQSYLPPTPSVYLAEACHDSQTKEESDASSSHIQSVGQSKSSWNDSFSDSTEESIEKTIYEVDADGNKVIYNSSYEDVFHLKNFITVKLTQFDYDSLKFYDVDNSTYSPVLVLGGETGFSNCAKKFAVENDGIQLSIPMQNGIESLNSSVATGIIVYEIKKQFRHFSVQNENRLSSKQS